MVTDVITCWCFWFVSVSFITLFNSGFNNVTTNWVPIIVFDSDNKGY